MGAWLEKSGIWKQGKWQNPSSNDKPEFFYGIDFVDNSSIRRAIMNIAPLVPRHYVIMEVKQNLSCADRKTNLKRFSLPHFKNIAAVAMGEPAADYKAMVHAKVLLDKQQKSDIAWKQKKQEKDRKRAIKKKQKEVAEKRKAAEEEAKRKKAEAEAKKKKEEDEKKQAEEGEKKEGEAAEKKTEDS